MACPGPPRDVGAETDKSQISHRETLLIKQLVTEERWKESIAGEGAAGLYPGWQTTALRVWPRVKPFWAWLVYTVKSWEESQRGQVIVGEGGTVILLMTM